MIFSHPLLAGGGGMIIQTQKQGVPKSGNLATLAMSASSKGQMSSLF